MKVLHVFDHSLPLHSGYSYRSIQILSSQHEVGLTPIGFTGPKQGACNLKQEKIDNFNFYRTNNKSKIVKNIPIIKHIFTIVSFYISARKVINEAKPNIIHVHSPSLNAIAIILAVRKKIPIVYEIRAFWEDAAVDHKVHSENGLRYAFSRRLETFVTKQVNSVITICNGLKQDLIKRGINKNIDIVPNAISLLNEEKVHLDDTIKEKYALNDKFVIGFIGSFYDYEGLDFLIKIMPKLELINPNVKLLLIGQGPQLETYKKIIHDLDLYYLVTLVNSIAHNQVPSYYKVFNLCVFPRKKMRLTDLVTPLKPLEAMYHKVPVLASNVGGHKELIQHNYNGLLYDIECENDFINKFNSILKKEFNVEQLIVNSNNFLLEKRNWKINGKKYKSIYEKVLCKTQ